jgi:hypothetical protein
MLPPTRLPGGRFFVNQIRELIETNRDLLLKEWNEYFRG